LFQLELLSFVLISLAHLFDVELFDLLREVAQLCSLLSFERLEPFDLASPLLFHRLRFLVYPLRVRHRCLINSSDMDPLCFQFGQAFGYGVWCEFEIRTGPSACF